MSTDQGILLLLLLALLVFLVWGRWRYDIVALAALFAASLFGLVPQGDIFSGFGSPATITVVLVLIVSHGLTKSGAVEYINRLIDPFAGHPRLHIMVLSFVAAFLSMFMNNVGALALLMPVAIQSAIKADRSPATVLMPLSFASILGGLVTLIGTPPNILIASYRQEVTGESFTMFDFTPVGGVIALAGIIFMLFMGWRLVKVRSTDLGANLFDIDGYLFETRVTEDSPVVGMSTSKFQTMLRDNKMDLLARISGDIEFAPPDGRYKIKKGDYLMIQGAHDDVQAMASEHKLSLHTATNQKTEFSHSIDTKVVEVVVTANSPLVGRTPADTRFNLRYQVNLLAVSRAGTPHQSRLRHFQMQAGDVLLLHGDQDLIDAAIGRLQCYPLAERKFDLRDSSKAKPALITFLLAIGATALGLMPIQLALGIATVAMAVTKVVPIREFYDGVDWPVVVLLGAMIPLGSALQETGTTDLLVSGILAMVGDMSPVFILVVLLVITMTVSDVLNNAATAILMAPIAYNIATSLGHNPDAFLMAVAVGASCAFLTPIGHQNNALIMGPGGYKFGDYWRMGLPLEVIIVIVAIPMLVLAWPL